jgi:hypothetical protein
MSFSGMKRRLHPSVSIEEEERAPWYILNDDILVELFLWLDKDLPSQFAFLWTTKYINTLVLKYHNLLNTKALLSMIPETVTETNNMIKTMAYNDAALFGYATLLEWYRKIGCKHESYRFCAQLARGGHLTLLKKYKKYMNKCWISDGVCRNAARGNHVAILEWTVEQGFYIENIIISVGCRKGLIDVMKFVKKQNRKFEFTTAHATLLILSGKLEAVKWMHKHSDYMVTQSSLNKAAFYGHLDIFAFLLKKGDRSAGTELYYAAEAGRMNIIEFCLTKDYVLDEKVAACVVKGAGTEKEARVRLEVLRKKHCSWDARTCSKLAGRGYLDTLKWARSEGCPWDEMTCAKATKYDRLEVLQYARLEGCPWDEETLRNALWYDRKNIFIWAKQNGAP